MNPHQQGAGQQQAGGFCGVPGADLAAMAQVAWGQMDAGGMPPQQQGGMPGGMQASMAMSGGAMAQGGLLGGADPSMGMAGGMGSGCMVPHGGMGGGAMGGGMGDQMQEQASISLSAQAELELELSLRGSLLVQQQRRIVQLEDELQRAWSEIDRLRNKISVAERDRQRTDEDSSKQPRYWTPDEHRLFMEAVNRYGWKDVKSIAQHVGTRTPTQVRTHAQKLFLRQQKESTGAMAPSKNGRADGLPPALPGDSYDGAGSSSSAPTDQLQTLQEAGQLAERQSSLDSAGDVGGVAGGMPGLPDSGFGDMQNMSNPDADPNAAS